MVSAMVATSPCSRCARLRDKDRAAAGLLRLGQFGARRSVCDVSEGELAAAELAVDGCLLSAFPSAAMTLPAPVTCTDDLFTTRSVSVCSPEKKLVVPESVCGRPLGLQFHHASGDLYVADAYLGLLRVPARGGLAKVVTTEAIDILHYTIAHNKSKHTQALRHHTKEPFLFFLNGFDVDQRTGDVYLTDSSSTYRRRYPKLNQSLIVCHARPPPPRSPSASLPAAALAPAAAPLPRSPYAAPPTSAR
uniref:Strictosidine synthase conserved region domain-containing protein n=1 Tax=Oryza rufipogon TaxID=4529 RepID=A0A0E0PG39_ORYRU